MKNKWLLLLLLPGLSVVGVLQFSAYATSSYFGVPNQAMGVPPEFDQTKDAITKSENSPGAKYCREKIVRAKALAKEGVETYWACRTAEGMNLLAQARKLAKEAESCQPPPRAIALPQPRIGEKVIILALDDTHFDFDKAILTKEAQVILKRNIQILEANPKVKVRIAGYTSASGTESYNQRLSERRATAVKEYLTKEGVIAPNRLSTIGYGEIRPAMYEAAPKDLYSEAAKANMRVLFEIIVE